jgi:hypothetical protein
MMTSWDLITAWADRIKADPTVAAAFGSTPKIRRGVNLRDRSGVADAPCVILFPVESSTGEDSDRHARVINVVVLVHDGSTTGTTDDLSYDGQETVVQDVAPAVLAAIEAATPDASVSRVEAELFLDEFPLVGCRLAVTVTVPVLVGDGPSI